MKQPSTIKTLVSVISETDRFFKSQAQRQVNVALTIRNWLIGFYIVEYEQNGDDRAVYGGKLIDNLSVQLRAKKLIYFGIFRFEGGNSVFRIRYGTSDH